VKEKKETREDEKGVGLKGEVRRDEKGRGYGGKAMKQWKWWQKERGR
jgi:hypothetical protein